jgi:DNA mismatch repair protein MutS
MIRCWKKSSEEILSLDINTLTPVEALMKLNEIKRMLVKNNLAVSISSQ